VKLEIAAEKLHTGLLGGEPSTYLLLESCFEDGQYAEIFRSPVRAHNKSPHYGEIRLSVGALCNGDELRTIRVFIQKEGHAHDKDPILQYDTCLKELRENPHLTVHLGKKKEITLIIGSKIIVAPPSFLDYMKNGAALKMIVAIDFTGSNGDPADADSLHHTLGAQPNEYQHAIQSVGQVLAEYSNDQKFSVWGFGAKLVTTGHVSHCFNLTFSGDDHVIGVDGIQNTYKNNFHNLLLSGPTHLSEVISTAGKRSSVHFTPLKQEYTVLLILTDGVINDLSQTVKAIIVGSGVPMSIIIVGVGGADFSEMESLEAENRLLHAGDLQEKRDIVQFVPFRDFENGDPTRLAAAVLKKVPVEFMDYCKMVGAEPMAATLKPSGPPRYQSVDEKSDPVSPPGYGYAAPPPN